MMRVVFTFLKVNGHLFIFKLFSQLLKNNWAVRDNVTLENCNASLEFQNILKTQFFHISSGKIVNIVFTHWKFDSLDICFGCRFQSRFNNLKVNKQGITSRLDGFYDICYFPLIINSLKWVGSIITIKLEE